jgi:hypothetical protein
MPTPDEDLDYWLATQALPKEEPGGGESQGSWQKAAQLLGAQPRREDPMPTRPNGMSWATALAAIAGKDPGGVIAADAANRRADLQDWYKRQGTGGELEIRRGNLDARNRELALQERALEARMGRANGTAGPWAEAQRVLTGQPPPDPDEVRAARADAAQVGSFEAPPRSAALEQPSPDEVERVDDFTAPEALPKQGKAPRAAAGPAAPIGGGGEMTPGAARAAALDQRVLNDYRKQNAKLFDLAQAAQGIDQVWERNKGRKDLLGNEDMPGVGKLDSSTLLHPGGAGLSDDDLTVRRNLDSLAEYLQNKITGAAAPAEQAKRIQALAGAQSGATEQQARVALDIIRENLRSQLRASGVGREEAARKVLAEMGGLDEWVYGKKPTAEQLAAEVPRIEGPPTADDAAAFQPKGVKVGKQVSYATPGELGPPQAIDVSDWKKRYERFKAGGQP